MIGKKINQLATELAPVSTDLTIIGDPVSGVSKKITLAQLGAIFSGAVSFYNNLASFPALGDINVIYCAKDTKKLYLWDGSTYVEVFPAQALLDTYQLRSEKGVSNGYASLDSGGKVPISQLPSSIMEYKGTWNAATNTPTLANGTGDTGDVYICNVAGTVNFGAGPITFAVGDYTIYSGSIWQRSSGAVGTVTSVAVSRSGDALAITGSPITTSGTINIGFAGTGAQYIKGDGTLATFPSIISQAQNLITEVYNNTGATLTKGTIVYINGGQGNLPTVTKALATSDATSAQTYGVVQTDITNMNNGYVVVEGRLGDLDTQAYANGTQLYLSPTTAGTWTSTKPYAPNHLVYVGIVVRSHPTQGVVEVKIMNGFEMDELHNVAAQSPDNNDILQYKTATSLWTKVAGTTSNIAEGSNLYYTDARSRAALSFTAGSGAYNSTTGVITIPTNTNQLTNGAAFITLTSLAAGAGISYNNTTGVIASTITQYTDAMARAAISLTTTGTSGAATYNNVTGVLNIPNYAPDLSGYVPTSRTLTINGTAFDLSANRSWSVGTVTSVGLSSATSGVTIGSTPITTSGTITLAIATASGSQQGLLSSTDWNTFNNKQNALTNPVTGTGTTNYLPKFTGTSTIGNSQIFDDGTNVLIGTNSTGTLIPTTRFGVLASSGAAAIGIYGRVADNEQRIDFQNNSGSARIMAITAGNTQASIFVDTNIPLIFATNGAERMRLTPSGNLGLGVTPSAWGSNVTALELPQSVSLYSWNASAVPQLYLGANHYWDGSTWRYKITGQASTLYYQAVGQHQWFNAPSGTAGNAISFTQAMTLNASGNLSIGNTNDSFKLDVTGTGRFTSSVTTTQLISLSASGSAALFLKDGSTNNKWEIGHITNSLYFYNYTRGSNDLILNGSTGAATFSSSVQGNRFFSVGSLNSTDGSFYIDHPSVQTWKIGVNNANTSTFSIGNDNGGAFVTKVFNITNAGNVGIGTISPSQRLSVTSADNTSSTNIARFAAANNTLAIGIGYETIRQTETGGIIAFETNSTERMRITSGGNVEIATGSIKTGEPDTGWGRAAIKIGASVSGAAFNVTRYLPVNVDGTVYFINLNSSTP